MSCRGTWLAVILTGLTSSAASAQSLLSNDSDGDGIFDHLDAYPCDANTGSLLATSSMVVYEDQWPEETDLDFNDIVLRVHHEFYRDAQGRPPRIRIT